MKIAGTLLGIALVLITAVMLFLLKNGGALKPVGVIKPSAIGEDPALIGRSIGLRLFPDFREARNVIWYLDGIDGVFADVPKVALASYQFPEKPELRDLRQDPESLCPHGCWYIQSFGAPLPEALQKTLKPDETVEIYVQYFDRNEPVPSDCEAEKILETKCVKPVSVREIRRKLKSDAPHFFMRRYQKHQFYLFIEKGG